MTPLTKGELAARILYKMKSWGAVIHEFPMPNIVYLQDADSNGTPVDPTPGIWNDRSILLMVKKGVPGILHNVPATTSAGNTAVAEAKKIGKYPARVIPGYHHEKWAFGFHKGDPAHPALRQVDRVYLCRDSNWNGDMDDEIVSHEIVGINQHGTAPRYKGPTVGKYSAGCLVRWYWTDHMTFIKMLTENAVFQEKKSFRFSATIIPAKELFP